MQHVILACCFFSILSRMYGAGVSFSGDWEDGLTGPGNWRSLQIVDSDRFQRVTEPVRQGQYALRVEVRPGDDPIHSSGERAEALVMLDAAGQRLNESVFSGTQYYAFSVRLDADWQMPEASKRGRWAIIFQLHGPDALKASPALAVRVHEQFELSLHSGDLDSKTDSLRWQSYSFSDGSLNRGNWVDLVLRITFAADFTGAVQVWRRDEGEHSFREVLSLEDVPTLHYRSSQGTVGEHYWKHGLYRSKQTTLTNVLWLDGLTRGDSFEAVVCAAFDEAGNVVGESPAADEATMVTVYPEESPGALRNPLKGFRPDLGQVCGHEYATLARHYIKWNELENDEDDSIQKIRDFCNEKWAGLDQLGIKVIPRVYLDWDSKSGNEYWPADLTCGDYSSDEFKRRLERLIQRLGAVWDQDPRVAWVQMGIIGYWGEHHNPDVSEEMQKLMGDAFTEAFPNKKFLVRHADTFTDYEVGYYWDSWAHYNQVDQSRHGAGIVKVNEMTGRWKTHPIEGEVAYNWGRHDLQPGDSPDDTLVDPEHLDFLLDTIRQLHCSGLGWVANYNPDDPRVAAGAAEVQKAFGYRFVIPRFSYSRRVEPGGLLRLSFDVINRGSAPFYEDWPLVLNLLDPQSGSPIWTQTLDAVDVRQWLPGDQFDTATNVYLKPAATNVIDLNLTLPESEQLPVGEYIVALALVDPSGLQPNVRFAINNYGQSGHHLFGRVGVGRDVLGSCDFDSDRSDVSLFLSRLAYSWFAESQINQ
jgi:hypothetical protein